MSQRVIVIFYPQFYGVHGIARYLDSFLDNLPESHPDIILITGDEFQMDRNYEQVEILHLPFAKSRFSLISWSWKARGLLKNISNIREITSVNFHFPPLIPGLFLPKEVKVVLTAHTTYEGMSGNFYPEQHFKSPWNPIVLFVKKMMEKIIFLKTDHVVTLTEQGRKEVLTYGYSGPISVVPNGVDLTKFNPNDDIVKDVDVLFCGRIEKRKGSRPMVEVCKQLIASRPDIKISIVGYGDDDEYVISEMAQYSGNVVLEGKVPFEKMMGFYNRSKVYVSTSYYEGLPGTCLEALAMKLPVVVWDFEFYNPLVLNGVNGKLLPPNQYPAMVKAINELLTDDSSRIAMGNQGRHMLEEHYNWSSLSAILLRIMTP